mgnify:CR=1 FL=1
MSNDNTTAVQGYTAKEEELIKQLVQSRLARNETLEYEDLDGYEIPPRTQFSMLKKPAVTIKYGKMKFNMASVRLFEGVINVLVGADSIKKRLIVIPCKEEESASVEWARMSSKGIWTNKEIGSLEYIDKIFDMMGWKRECRYKALGRIVDSVRGLALRFDLEEAIMFNGTMAEYTDPKTGEVKKKQIIYYPDMYKGHIGKAYSDYVGEQTSTYDDLSGYSGNIYSNGTSQVIMQGDQTMISDAGGART